MNIKIQRLKVEDLLKSLIISFLVIIGTFPENDWTFSVGIDGPLKWVFNYLFENGLDIGKNIIFPHGPLGFLMYPLQENILLATLVTSILKALLVFNIIWLFKESKNQKKWLASFFIAYIFSLIAGFNHLILANIILLYCNFFLSNSKAFKYFAFFLTSFAFFIKAYIAIITGVLFVSFILYYFFKTRKIKTLLIDGFLLLGLMVFVWILMYGTLNGFMQYIHGMISLAQNNSSATSYYPYNNWFILIVFAILLISIFIINWAEETIFFGFLIALSLFAAWKHGMAREDIYHVNGFFIYTIFCLTIFIIFYKKNIYVNIVLSVVVVFSFSLNMKNSVNYFPLSYEISRINNFVEFVSDFQELKQESIDNIRSKTLAKKLPQEMLDKISDSSVDIYPWDYSIISANHLNWQPRDVIHSYASYTSYLDNRNAEHFKSEYAPEYIIWESEPYPDFNGGDINSIDNRYLLNDEPLTILQILSNYDHYYSDNKFNIFEKRIEPVLINSKQISKNESTWGEWIDVPENDRFLLRTKLKFSNSLLQSIKSFLYKDEQFWIYFKLQNGSIHRYRIVQKNAADGLWINPYIFSFEKAYTVAKIMFKCSNQLILTKKLTVEWEQIEFKDNPERIEEFFNISKLNKDSLIYNSINHYEQLYLENWSNLKNDQLIEVAFEKKKSYLLKANSFSSVFSFPLDSIPFQELRITADCWILSPNYKLSNNTALILSVEDENGSIVWKSRAIDGQLIDGKQWNNIFNFIDYNHKRPNCILKAYVWNTSDNEAMIDNFRVMIFNSDKP